MRSETEKRPAIAWQASVLLVLLITPLIAHAQQTAPPPATPGVDSRFDFFAGYSYWATQGSVESVPFLGSNQGINVNASWFFRRYFGVQLDGKYFYNESNNSLSSISAGPVFRIPTSHGFTPFFHVLMGAADIEGPLVPVYPGIAGPSSATWGPQFTAGEGLDYEMPWLHHRFALRLGQADYMYDQVKFSNGFSANLNSLTLSTGLVVHFGGAAQTPPKLRCSAFPKAAFAGEPVTVSSMASGLDPKRPAVYHWASPNLRVSGSAPGLDVDTSGLHPGTYTIVVQVSQRSQATQSVNCTTSFAIQEAGARPE